MTRSYGGEVEPLFYQPLESGQALESFRLDAGGCKVPRICSDAHDDPFDVLDDLDVLLTRGLMLSSLPEWDAEGDMFLRACRDMRFAKTPEMPAVRPPLPMDKG